MPFLSTIFRVPHLPQFKAARTNRNLSGDSVNTMALASFIGGRSTKNAQSLAGRAFTVVPRTGVEPVTPGFSDRCSTS